MHGQDPPEYPTGCAACTHGSPTLQKLLHICGHRLRLELQRVVVTVDLHPLRFITLDERVLQACRGGGVMRHLRRGIKRPTAPVIEMEGPRVQAGLGIFKGVIKRLGPLPPP